MNRVLDILLIFTLNMCLCRAQVQTISFYSNANCSTDSLQRSVTDQTGTFVTNSSSSVKGISILGLWKVEFASNSNIEDYGLYSSPTCKPYAIDNGTEVRVRRYGDSNMTDSTTLTFFTGPNFGGDEQPLSSNNNSNTEYKVGSYFFTGSDSSWLIYESTNYTGAYKCLFPSTVIKQRGWGVTGDYQFNMTVKSYQRVKECPGSTGNAAALKVSASLAGNILGVLLVVFYLNK